MIVSGFSIAANVKPRPDHIIPAPSCASAHLSHTGLSLLFEVGVRPPHDGIRRMRRPNLSGALAADERQDQRPLRTHPTRRPREDIFLPKQNALISLTVVFFVLRGGSGNRRNRGAVLPPPELAAIDPHPVQNDSQTPGDRDDRSTHPASLGDSHAPCLQPRPFCAASKQYMCRLVEHRAQQGIATFGHPAFIVGLARLVALRRQADMRADRPGMDETLRLVDRRTVSQCYHCADPWGGHQPPAHWVAADRIQQHLCRTANCCRMTRRTLSTGSTIAASLGNPATSSRTRASYRPPLTTPTFKPKLRSVPRKSDSTSSSLR